MPLPDWLASAPATAPCARVGRAVPRSFADRTLLLCTGFLGQMARADGESRRPGLLQGLEARAKILSLVALLLAAGVVHELAALVLLGGVALALANASRLSPEGFVPRALVAAFLLGVVLALPAIFNWFVPGTPWATLASTPAPLRGLGLPDELAITREGTLVAARLLARALVSALLALLLVATTPFGAVLAGLAALRVPSGLVLVLGMTWRYVALLVRTVEDMHLALKSRSLGRTSRRDARGWVSGRVGLLLARTSHLADEVHLAMRARGYLGTIRRQGLPPWRGRDVAAVAAAVALAVAVGIAGS